MLIVDAHEDLAYNALVNGRNYLQSAHEIRAQEVGTLVAELNGRCMLGLPEWLAGGVAIVFATLFTQPRTAAESGGLGYVNSESAYFQALAQLQVYRAWAEAHPQVTLITHRSQLQEVLLSWDDPRQTETDGRQIGLVLLMENAAPVRYPAEIAFWHEQGVRIIGPAWSANRYTGSNRELGPLTELGRQLLAEMAKYGLALDITHMSDEATEEALQRYEGPVIASHANPRRLVPGARMLSDQVIEQLVSRDGIVGIMPANWAVHRDWRRGSGKDSVLLSDVVRAIDVVCQLAGDVNHVGLGTDFDGGFGAEAVPAELETIANLPRLADALIEYGYREERLPSIMGQNWLRLLWQILPD